MSDEPVKVEVEAPVTEAGLDAVEVQAEAETEQVETVADAAVQIAEIEANKEIILAEIAAEARVAEAEIYTERVEQEEQDGWRQNIEMQLAAMQETQAAILAQLTPPQSPPVDTNPSLESNPESDASEVTPGSPVEPEAAEPAPEPQKPRKKSRWI